MAGGYYPVGLSLEESKRMMAEEPAAFKEKVQESLRRQVAAINKLTAKGMYFFDYGNAFLLESSRAGADIMKADGKFRYPSYVQDIMGPMFFDYGFGPFRWVCSSGDPRLRNIRPHCNRGIRGNTQDGNSRYYRST